VSLKALAVEVGRKLIKTDTAAGQGRDWIENPRRNAEAIIAHTPF
jgi:hypothetical protein